MEHDGAAINILLVLTLSIHVSLTVKHTLQYVLTGVTPGINFPEFTEVGQVDGEEFIYYDSEIKKAIPKTNWIKKINTDDPDYWNRNTHHCQGNQEIFKANVIILMQRFNHTTGVHTVQWLYGCERDDNGTTRGYYHDSYDGEDFISLDPKTVTWTAAKPQALITKHKWESDAGYTNYAKNYLEKECVESLNTYLSYSREIMERTVLPEVSVFHKRSPSPEVVCHATGFFPKPLNITWQKDGEDVHEDVELSETLHNQDGSFQKRSILKVPAEELQKHAYTCVVQHSSLEKELVREVPKGGGSDGAPIAIITAVVAALVALVAVVAGIVVWKKKNSGFKPVPPKPSSEGDSSNTSLKCDCGDNDTLCLD